MMGAVYGAAVGTYVLACFEDGSHSFINEYPHRLAICFAAVPWQMLMAFFSGFEVVSMALTSPLVLALCANKKVDFANEVGLAS